MEQLKLENSKQRTPIPIIVQLTNLEEEEVIERKNIRVLR